MILWLPTGTILEWPPAAILKISFGERKKGRGEGQEKKAVNGTMMFDIYRTNKVNSITIFIQEPTMHVRVFQSGPAKATSVKIKYNWKLRIYELHKVRS